MGFQSRAWDRIEAKRPMSGHRNSNRCHNFHATGSSEYLRNGAKPEVAHLDGQPRTAFILRSSSGSL